MNTRQSTEELVLAISAKGRTRTDSGPYYPELSNEQRRSMFKQADQIPRRFLAGLLFDEMIAGKENAVDASPKDIRTALVKAIAQCLKRTTVTNMVSAFSGWRRCPVIPGAVFGALVNASKNRTADQNQKISARRKLAAGAQGSSAARKLHSVWMGRTS